QTPDMIVTTAIQEDVDVIGLSFLSGSHKELVAEIIKKMKAKKLDMVLVVGGIIPAKDWDYLKSLGVDAVFGPGSNTDVITQAVTKLANTKRGMVAAG
ncbi:MAG: cobalamin-dependent protein, partial [Dehalococcoidales bacterium]|nr:cobalamin-dependent protein [Dehalococcoidales bacterium]